MTAPPSSRLGVALPLSLVVECNAGCACDPATCGNRVVQGGIPGHVALEVFRAGATKGWGCRSRTAIAAGTFVAAYVGEVMADEDAERTGLAGPTGAHAPPPCSRTRNAHSTDYHPGR
jgi:hypothetical protein